MKASLSSLKNLLLTHRFGMAACSFALLVLQNIVIFYPHYSGSVTFLNDFARNIYPMIAFWTSLVQHGIFPEWTPFQAMGMPFVLTMQSGVFYLPLWIFVIFKVPFTLHMAAVVQVLHVLWGAIGCWMFARLLGRSYGAALFAAIAFQFFGGFYSNAEHIDIVRAFSYIPWLFWVIHVSPAQRTLVGRNWFTPLIMMLFVTGAYQGNLVAHLFILGLSWALSWFANQVQRDDKQFIAKLHLQLAALMVLGILMCSVYLLPTLAVKTYLARDGVWSGQFMNWPFHYWNTLIMHSNAEGQFILPSMLSAFITVPVFCVLFLVTPATIRQNGVWFCITLFALVMACGSNFFVYPWMIKILPQLGSSRFPSSDYRGIMCFGLIVLSSGILDDYLNGAWQRKLTAVVAWCLGLLCFFYLANLLVFYLSSPPAADLVHFLKNNKITSIIVGGVLMFASSNIISAEISEWPVVIILASLVFFALHHFRTQYHKAMVALVVLEIISGLYFVNRISIYWRSDVTTDEFYQEVNHESPYSILAVIDNPVATRSACHDMNLFSGSWRGYLLGDFMCQTQDSKTRPREVVNANAVINAYMRQSSQARLIQPQQLSECKPEAVLQANSVATQIHSLSYGLQQINYRVNASEKFCFVENELLFPGWSGVIGDDAHSIQPQAYCGALRSWCLPEGQYQFTAKYRAPWLREGAVLSLVFFVIYAALYFYWRRMKVKV